MVRGEAEPVALTCERISANACVCPLTRCRLVSGLQGAVGVFPVACSDTAVPVVSALAFVLEYPEALWHQLLQNLVRRHCDLFGTMFGTSLR